ncbi:hypothetical protein [Paraburkholderia phytofirmans]|uniref:hypothetical protein n=1 Tax=Paraburkholderia phytofirmans TaxID=261302 RepID=UPI0038B7D399
MNYLSALEQATVQLSTSYTAAEAINSLPTLFLAVAATHAIVTFAATEYECHRYDKCNGHHGDIRVREATEKCTHRLVPAVKHPQDNVVPQIRAVRNSTQGRPRGHIERPHPHGLLSRKDLRDDDRRR